MKINEFTQPGEVKHLLTEKQAIERLALTDRPNPKGSLRWLMRTRRLPFVRVARGITGFRQADLDAFVDANRVGCFNE